MVLENLQVKHKAFGVGSIVGIQGKYIKVRFENAEKTFVYPDIFEKFLTLADGSVSDDIKSDISMANAEKERIVAKKKEENIRAMTKGIVIPGKEISQNDGEDDDNKGGEAEEI